MTKRIERVCVLGLGYVGLPTAAVLAAKGVEVVGVDTDPERVTQVNAGIAPISEPDLDALLRGVISSGRLRATVEVCAADVFVIAVPTPLTRDREPDLSHLRQATNTVAQVLEPGNLVLLESTSPVGTTEMLSRELAALRSDLSFPHLAGDSSDIRVAYSPERVLPGQILAELVNNERVVGGITRACTQAAIALYRRFVDGSCFATNARTAELVKLAENAYRDVNVAFANEMSLVCNVHDVNPWEVIELANRHPRVDVLQPGPGVGGHCIPIDPWFLVDAARDSTALVRAARAVNDGMPHHLVKQVLESCTDKPDATICCLGLAYKANVGDLRESPAVEVVQELGRSSLGRVGRIVVVEPNIDELPPSLASHDGIELGSLDTAISTADVVVLLTDHDEFVKVDRALLATKAVVDARGTWRLGS